jgi:hypothetical protein
MARESDRTEVGVIRRGIAVVVVEGVGLVGKWRWGPVWLVGGAVADDDAVALSPPLPFECPAANWMGGMLRKGKN